MRVKVILNPTANNGKAGGRYSDVQQALTAVGLDYDIELTIGRKHATKITVVAVAAGYDAVIAAGGDGTINEVVNGLIEVAGDAPTLPLGILPIGTGNDLSDMLALPRDLQQAVQQIAKAQTRQIDLGCVTVDGTSHYFDNNCALAMEALITHEHNQIERLSGIPRYIWAVIKGLFKLKAWRMSLEWDDGHFDGDLLLCSICNGPRTGSTFLMAPDAQFEDGLFDVVFVPEIPMRTVLPIVVGLLNGSHLAHPEVHHIQTRKLKVTCHMPAPIHADGELLASNATAAICEVLPQKLTILY